MSLPRKNNELLRFLKKHNHDHYNHRNDNNNGWNQRNGSDKPEPDPTSYLGFVGSVFFFPWLMEFDPTLFSYHADVVVGISCLLSLSLSLAVLCCSLLCV